MSRRIYYINYLHPRTGFNLREDFDTVSAMHQRVRQLTQQGITEIRENSYVPGRDRRRRQ